MINRLIIHQPLTNYYQASASFIITINPTIGAVWMKTCHVWHPTTDDHHPQKIQQIMFQWGLHAVQGVSMSLRTSVDPKCQQPIMTWKAHRVLRSHKFGSRIFRESTVCRSSCALWDRGIRATDCAKQWRNLPLLHAEVPSDFEALWSVPGLWPPGCRWLVQSSTWLKPTEVSILLPLNHKSAAKWDSSDISVGHNLLSKHDHHIVVTCWLRVPNCAQSRKYGRARVPRVWCKSYVCSIQGLHCYVLQMPETNRLYM